MAIVKTKKGGSSKFVIDSFKNLDMITIPAGHVLKKVTVKKSGTTAGNIKLGDYVDAVAEVVNIVVTGDPTANGNISVSLRGATAVLIPVVIADTIATTVTKIVAGVYPGWTVAESLGTTVTWTATVPGLKSGVTTVTGPAGFAKTGPSEVPVGADATAGEQTVASAALSGTDQNLADLTLVKTLYSADTDVYIAVSSLATGTISFRTQKLF